MSVAYKTQSKERLEPRNNALEHLQRVKLYEGLSRISWTVHRLQLITKRDKTLRQLVTTTYYRSAVQCRCTSVNNYEVR